MNVVLSLGFKMFKMGADSEIFCDPTTSHLPVSGLQPAPTSRAGGVLARSTSVCVDPRSPQAGGGFEGKSPDDRLMRTNPYGIILLERHRLGLKFHEITLTPL